MTCSLGKRIRYILFPGTKEIDEKSEEIGKALELLKEQNIEASQKIKQLKQHDMLRSLVISMNAGRNR